MGADGLDILDGLRAAGIPVRSIFMDRAAYQRWEAYGTSTDSRGTPLAARPRQATSQLTAAERALYEDPYRLRLASRAADRAGADPVEHRA